MKREASSVVGCAPQKMLRVLALLFIGHSLAVGSERCPPGCLCYDSSDVVKCRAKGLDKVPQDLPRGTWFLDLGANDLVKLEAYGFDQLWSLKVLVLSNNRLKVLLSKTFCNLSFLERLDMSGNKLQQLPPDFSECLGTLRELRLGGNDLKRLEPPCLENLESLEKLDLSYNRVQTVALRALWTLTHLRHLNLQGNQLATLKDGRLFMLQSLEVLLLGNNSIFEIETEALVSLRGLSLLGLEDNRLSQLNFRIFYDLHTAGTHLRLSGNPWSCDCDLHHVFSKLQSVRHLHVDDYQNVTCHEPDQLAGELLVNVDNLLCMPEIATVLVITVTVLVTVIAAIVMAERNRRKGCETESDLDFQEKFRTEEN